MVLITYDDAVTVTNYVNYSNILFNRLNPNGCPVKATFFVSHEYNNYTLVNDLYNRGHEIGVHSITHRTNSDFWTAPVEQNWISEMVDMRTMLEYYAGVPASSIKGTRAPFLLMGGDTMFQVYKDNGFEWDCSWATRNFVNPGMWPYTLDYRSVQECPVGTCPTESYPGMWVAPMVDLFDPAGNPCAMLDTCNAGTTAADVKAFLKRNFEVQYNSTRAPFGLFLHAAWLQNSAQSDGYKQFIDEISTLDDVYFVTVSQMLEWVKNPTPISNLGNFAPWQCQTTPPPAQCTERRCAYSADFTPFGSERIMSICTKSCPFFYPWYENIYGSDPPTPWNP